MFIQFFSVILAVFALLISIIAVYFTIKIYDLKRGVSVRGSFSYTISCIYTKDKFVNEITIENLKDRTVVIFAIYLKLSRNFMIEIERFDNKPFILKPYEVLRRNYDPVDGYTFNMRRYDINHIFNPSEYTSHIILSTPDGRIKVKKQIEEWDPVSDWFRNHLIVTLQTHRVKFHDKSYGGNALYLVELIKDGDLIHSIPIYKKEYEYKWFKDLGGDKKDLLSPDRIRSVFERAITGGKFSADAVNVIEIQEVLRSTYRDYKKSAIQAQNRSWFMTYVVGKILTKREEMRIRKINKNNKANIK